jgi:tRNA (Thr-GGU) A37 N-methylase
VRSLSLTPIGTVKTAHGSPEHTPVQSSLNWEEQGEIEIAEDYRESLEGLEGFDYAWLVA